LVKNSLAIAGNTGDGVQSLSGRSPEGRNGNLLQYSSLENSTGREAWQAIVHGVAKSWAQLK